uniref:BHLH domain-containing protein n=1 Tax=Chenopodium quinoa TaxID=63459 RepID=A0A803KTN5_CHEQI
MTELKRSVRPIDQDSFTSVASKRQKVDISMSSKERKEKLGEKITTLQQLVSPYGKTDTASVLHEAMEYIRFLHEQVKVLSAPYLNNTPDTIIEVSNFLIHVFLYRVESMHSGILSSHTNRASSTSWKMTSVVHLIKLVLFGVPVMHAC